MPYKDALKALKNMEASFDRDRVGIREVKSITFSEFSLLYLNYSRANKAFRTWERDITSIKSLTPHFGNMLLEAINNENIEFYKAKRQSDGVKPRTINIELQCLSNMLKKAIEWDYLKTIPIIKKLRKKQSPLDFCV